MCVYIFLQSELNGMSGLVKFDHAGFRSNFVLDIVELSFESGLTKKGTWNSTEGLKLTHFPQNYGPSMDVENLQNKTFVVMIAMVSSFMLLVFIMCGFHKMSIVVEISVWQVVQYPRSFTNSLVDTTFPQNQI